MNSVVQIYITDKDGIEEKMHCHNIVTSDGDLYYTKTIAGEDTSLDFPELLLEFGAEPEGEFVDPEKFYTGTLVPITTKAITRKYHEPYASLVYEVSIRNDIPEEFYGAVVYQIALVNGLEGDDKKAVSVVNLPQPIILSELMYATFKIKHSVHFPGTEDNTIYLPKPTGNDKTLLLDLPDLDSENLNIYYLENIDSEITKIKNLPSFKQPNKLVKNKVEVTVYRSKCQETKQFTCIPYEHNFLGCAEVDTVYAKYSTNSIEQVPEIPYNAFVSYHTIITPATTGLWRFSYTGGFLLEIFLDGKRAFVANTQNDGIYPDVGYNYLEAGKQYSLVVNHVQVHGKDPFKFMVVPQNWTNLQSYGLPFTESDLYGYMSFYNESAEFLDAISRTNHSVLRYGLITNFVDERLYSLTELPNTNRFLLRLDYPKATNGLIALRGVTGFLKGNKISIIKVNPLDIYYRSSMRILDGGASFPTVHIYSLKMRWE